MKTWAFLSICLFSLPTWAQSLRFESDVLFVKLKRGEASLHHPLLQKQKRLFGDVYQLQTTDAVLLENDLRQNPTVAWVEKSFEAEPNDHSMPIAQLRKSALSSAYGFNDSKLSGAWAYGDDSRFGISLERAYQHMPAHVATPVIVAVIDTGIDYRHEDLRDSMWRNPREIPGNGVDDDKNGHVDDVYGIDLIDRDSDPTASSFHGTHVAGIIGATQGNGKGLAGVASHAQLMSIRAVPDETNETDKDIITALLYAAQNGARIINCSFGKKRQSVAVEETIDHITRDLKVLVVTASGNDSQGSRALYDIDRRPQFPAGFRTPSLLVTTATTARGTLAEFANVGKINVDVGAPGEKILSTMPKSRYGYSDGTSMAAPMVSGIAAQLLTYYPTLTPVELKTIIMNSAVPMPALRDRTLTGARVDLARAMDYALQYYPGR